MDKYIIEDNLGLDHFAERFTVRRKDADGILLLSKIEMMDMPMAVVTYREYQPLLKLSSEIVASYFDIFTSIDHHISAPMINLVSEYFPFGHLDRYLTKLRNERELLHLRLIEKWFGQILEGLLYLWNENVVHRNLKPESIFLRGNHHENECSLVLADFLPASMAFDFRMRTRLPRRTLSYTAPEVLQHDEYSFSSDIYSFGCVLLDLITTDRLNDDEILQLRICARHDLNTLLETLNELKNVHENLAELIGRMMIVDPTKRLSIKDFRHDDFVIEAMHAINSNQMKYPAERDRKYSSQSDLTSNENFEFYSNFLQLNRNNESRVEHALDLLSRSQSVDPMSFAAMFQMSILPIVEPYRTNEKILRSTLDLLGRVVQDDLINTPKIVAFLSKILVNCAKNEYLIGKLLEILLNLANRNVELLIKTRPISDLVGIMLKYENNAHISIQCCSLIWLIGKDAVHVELRKHQPAIFLFLETILRKHPKNAELFTKSCFAFYPFVHQKATLELLIQFNLVRLFTIGLNEHVDNARAIKTALQILSELFQLDERCVMRFLCSRTSTGELLDAMEILHRIFKRYDNDEEMARELVTLLQAMLPYNDAVDEMVSTKINETLLFEIKRFHSGAQDIAEICEKISKRIRRRTPVT